MKALCLMVRKLCAELSFSNVGQRTRLGSRAQNFYRKGLVNKKTPAQYESHMSNGKKVISEQKGWQMNRSRRTTDKVIPRRRSASLAPQKVRNTSKNELVLSLSLISLIWSWWGYNSPMSNKRYSWSPWIPKFTAACFLLITRILPIQYANKIDNTIYAEWICHLLQMTTNIKQWQMLKP